MKTLQNYTVYCTKEQTNKAYRLGVPMTICKFTNCDIAGIKKEISKMNTQAVVDYQKDRLIAAIIPTAEQMMHYLREEKLICLQIMGYIPDKNVRIHVVTIDNVSDKIEGDYKTAITKAIDWALDYLKNKQ